ncbi:MAG: zinc ribbon domain-containing protein [candidate division WOR-3 bacterium]
MRKSILAICPKCGFSTVAKYERFCPNCNTKLINACPECGASIQHPLAQFCPVCGAKYCVRKKRK